MLQSHLFRIIAAAVLVLSVITIFGSLSPSQHLSKFKLKKPNTQIAITEKSKKQKLHVLLPTSNGDVNLCKTILSARAMGYSDPIILGWNQSHSTSYLLGGGSHIAKISKVLEWLESMDPERDDELVLMMDAFDIWFQLPQETLISRYHSINERANKRISDRMGKAAEIENVKQTVIFGAGKRCAPNQLHTIACYPIPESPVPHDIYGENTDTTVGRNLVTSYRQRFLNSGYIIGPVGDMRKVFAQAWYKVQHWPIYDPIDKGDGGSDFMYHGSDQAAFAVMFGEQEFQREVMRRRHMSKFSEKYDKLAKASGMVSKVDILNPPPTHQTMEHFEGRPYEFGIGLDYFSDLGHQTMNADHDGVWLRYDDSPEVFQNKTQKGRNMFDCQYRGKRTIPADMKAYPASDYLPEGRNWEQVNLYTNLCMDTIPVMVHHNGDKKARERQWPEFWVQQYGRQIVEKGPQLGATLFNNVTSEFMTWDALCPSSYSKELYRDHKA